MVSQLRRRVGFGSKLYQLVPEISVLCYYFLICDNVRTIHRLDFLLHPTGLLG